MAASISGLVLQKPQLSGIASKIQNPFKGDEVKLKAM
jgi:hypothetical protein